MYPIIIHIYHLYFSIPGIIYLPPPPGSDPDYHYFSIIYLYWPPLSAAIATPNIHRYIHTSLYKNYLNDECD